MRTKEEIEEMLSETKKEYDFIFEWANQAYLKYQKDKEYWGETPDRGELDTAYDCQKELSERIKILNWVLNK